MTWADVASNLTVAAAVAVAVNALIFVVVWR
jgi:hypothetical protein